MNDFEKRVDELVEALGCSIKEAEQIVLDDERIEKGEKLFEQTQEQKQASKKYRQGERTAPTVYKLDKRERKADTDKRQLVEMFAAAVAMVSDEAPTVTNVERQIDFVFKGRKFRVVLSAPRS